ncbi:MAG: hypothetical protein IPK07_34560 [Deltaproteobacteria bacterium]|nr:hypothetical protein [Deltaproteobacteria bacterium]
MKPEHWLLPEKPYATYQQYLAENRPSAVATALDRARGFAAEPGRGSARARWVGLADGAQVGARWRATRRRRGWW